MWATLRQPLLVGLLAGDRLLATAGEVVTDHDDKRMSRPERATTYLRTDDEDRLRQLGFTASGLNPTTHSNTSLVWIGSDGRYTNRFTNLSGGPLILVIWGPDQSWITKSPPLITASLLAASSVTVSFAEQASGAWASLYNDTKIVNGQIFETWGEYTFDQYSTVDVSRLVNMSGRPMQIVSPGCTSNMTTCVFTCPPGLPSCQFGASLLNCAPGSQPGASYGYSNGAVSGGCNIGHSTNLTTHLGTS